MKKPTKYFKYDQKHINKFKNINVFPLGYGTATILYRQKH